MLRYYVVCEQCDDIAFWIKKMPERGEVLYAEDFYGQEREYSPGDRPLCQFCSSPPVSGTFDQEDVVDRHKS